MAADAYGDDAGRKREGDRVLEANARADANAARQPDCRAGADDARRECADAHEIWLRVRGDDCVSLEARPLLQ